MTNTAAAVRKMGVAKVGVLAERFGEQWIVATLIPKVVECYNVEQQGYNYRMCALETLSAVMNHLSREMITEMIVPTVVKACGDRVPNVQFCVARIIKAQKGLFDPSIFTAQIVPKLTEMTQEADKDVAYFATLALQP